jgi:hypothetical protein
MNKYTDTLPEDQRDIVRRITARQAGDHFATNKAVDLNLSDELGDVTEWYEAIKNSETDLWTVTRFQSTPYLPDGSTEFYQAKREVKPSVIMRHAYFMDALHACATFEKLRENNATNEMRDTRDKVHYRDFAKAENIPFDLKTGMPIAVANGEILINGASLDEEDMAGLAKTRGNLVAVGSLKQPELADIVGQNAPARTTTTLPAIATRQPKALSSLSKQRSTLQKHQSKTNRGLQRLQEIFKLATQKHNASKSIIYVNDEKYGVRQVGATALHTIPILSTLAIIHPIFLTLPAASLIFGGLWCAIAEVNPIHAYTTFGHQNIRKQAKKQINKMRKITQKEPDAELRENSLRTLDNLEICFYALCARASFNVAMTNESSLTGWFKVRRMNSDIKNLEKIAAKHQMSKDDLDALKAYVMSPPVGPNGHDRAKQGIIETMQRHNNVLERDLLGSISRQICALPAPA